MLRIFAGGIATETNVFSPMPTGLGDYTVASPTDPETRQRLFGGSSFVPYADIAARRGCEYIQGSYAFALPAGVTPRAAYETLRDELLAEIEAALPLDCVLLTMHGAMVADGYEDCETDIARRVRGLIGAEAKIGVLLDLHCDLPTELVAETDAIITYKEYPHVDIDDRARELARLMVDAAVGDVDPQMAVFDCRMVGLYPTTTEPMHSFVDELSAAERQAGVLSVSLGHGFPWGDAPAAGARTLVVADGDPDAAEALAAELGQRFFALRNEVTLQPLPMRAALDRALSPASSARPIVVVDTADNPGGGAPSDSTFVLRELLMREVERAALGMVWDPIAAAQAFAAGPGAELTLRLGGKMGPTSGDPLDLTVTVRGLQENLVQRWPQSDGYLDIPCGRCACLTCDGVDVVVSSDRQQVLGIEAFSAFGIDLRERDLIVVKSSNHFHAAFAPIAADIVYMSAPGALSHDFPALPYTRVDTDRFPWVEDPWAREDVACP